MLRFGAADGAGRDVGLRCSTSSTASTCSRYERRGAAGLYALAVKLAAVVIFTVARRSSTRGRRSPTRSTTTARRARLYALVTTYYVLVTGLVVAALTLLGRWVVRRVRRARLLRRHEALPWVALGWALYGLFLVLRRRSPAARR